MIEANGHAIIVVCPICKTPDAGAGRCFQCEQARKNDPGGWELRYMKDFYTIMVGRLRANIGPDSDLDADIAVLVDHKVALPYTMFLRAAQTLLPDGFWWRGGSSYLSSEVRIGPDYNDPAHRERLLIEYPQALRHWDKGLEVEVRPGGETSTARAFAAVCLIVRGLGPAPKRPCAMRMPHHLTRGRMNN